MNCGIYKIENLVNGDFYLGGSRDLHKREIYHRSFLRRNVSKHILLQKAYNDFGAENFKFKVLLYCEPFELNRYEQKLMDLWNPKYNVLKEDVNTRKGIPCYDESKIKLSKKNRGQRRSDEVKMKMSLSQRGNKNCLDRAVSDETKQKISAGNKGKYISDETKQKMSLVRKGRKQSPEHIKNRVESKLRNRLEKLNDN
jgi:group I intron endonuclease